MLDVGLDLDYDFKPFYLQPHFSKTSTISTKRSAYKRMLSPSLQLPNIQILILRRNTCSFLPQADV